MNYHHQVNALGTIVITSGNPSHDLITRKSALIVAANADAEITRLTAERDAAREERDGLRVDAERYRWLRFKPLGWSIEHEIHGWVTSYGRDELNNQIDAAIAKEQKHG